MHAGGPAKKGGVVAGDIILDMDGKKINGPDALVEMLRARAPGDVVELHLVDTDGNTIKAKIELGVRPER